MARAEAVGCAMGMLLACALAATPVAGQDRSPCPELDLVRYAPARQLLRDRIVIESGTGVGGRFPPSRRFEEVSSPQRTAHALVSPPDFDRPGPWTTVVAVRGNQARPLELLITVADHGSGGVHLRWLNEKLIWLRVWWGRVVASELLLDVETAKELYHEESDLRDVVLDCEQKRQRLEAEAEQ